MSRQAWLISAICSSVRRSAAKAVASGSMMWRNSCTVLQEHFAVRRGRVPGQHVAIEQVPALLGLDPTADLGAGGQQALGHQHLDRLAHRRTADVEGFRPFRFVGQDGAGRIVAAHDPEADLAGQRGMHARPWYPGSVRAAADERPSGAVWLPAFDGFLPYALRDLLIVLTVAAGFMAASATKTCRVAQSLQLCTDQVPSTGTGAYWSYLWQILPPAVLGYGNRACPWPCGWTSSVSYSPSSRFTGTPG